MFQNVLESLPKQMEIIITAKEGTKSGMGCSKYSESHDQVSTDLWTYSVHVHFAGLDLCVESDHVSQITWGKKKCLVIFEKVPHILCTFHKSKVIECEYLPYFNLFHLTD